MNTFQLGLSLSSIHFLGLKSWCFCAACGVLFSLALPGLQSRSLQRPLTRWPLLALRRWTPHSWCLQTPRLLLSPLCSPGLRTQCISLWSAVQSLQFTWPFHSLWSLGDHLWFWCIDISDLSLATVPAQSLPCLPGSSGSHLSGLPALNLPCNAPLLSARMSFPKYTPDANSQLK